MQSFKVLIAGALALGLSVSAALADEVTEQIEEGLKAYKAGDFTLAKQYLETASQLINQKKAEKLPDLLPAPEKGWTVADIDDEAEASSTPLIGGITARRTYVSKDGTEDVTVEIAGDSPMLTQMAVVLMNPTLAGTLGKIRVIDKQRALIMRNGEIKLVVDNRFVVTVGGTAPEDTKIAYVESIDYDAIEQFE
ncbi:MAG: hypothetical protein AAGH45_00750 [Pseudomonadota bacterium]